MTFLSGKVFFLAIFQLLYLVHFHGTIGTHFGHSEYNNDYSDHYRDGPRFQGDDESGNLLSFYEDEEPQGYGREEPDEEKEEGTDDLVQTDKKDRSLCLTKECVVAAGKILSSMNPSADPCHDFYDYVCGNTKLSKEPFEDMTRTMSFESVSRENNYILHNIIKKMPVKSESTAIDKVKGLYDSCIANELKEEENINKVKKMIDASGPWPISKLGWKGKKWGLQKVVNSIFQKFGTSSLFSISVDLDSKEPTKHTFQVQQAFLALPREYYVSTDPVKSKVYYAYRTYMLKVMKLLGYDKGFQTSMVKDALEFEKKLAEISISGTNMRKVNHMYKRFTIAGLVKLVPEIDWKGLMKAQLELVGYKLSDVKFVVVMGKSYFQSLGSLLRKTKKETIANYLLLGSFSPLFPYIGKRFREERFKFQKIYTGGKSQMPFWLSCTRTVEKFMPLAFGRIYVDARFRSKFAKKEAERIIKEIKQSFIGNLKNVHWMSEDTKEKAKKKAEAIKELVAYPDFILDNGKLDEKYKDLQIDGSDFLGNVLKIMTFEVKENIRLLKEKRNRGRWHTGPSVVNAFYSQVTNAITFPAGILQPLFYHHEYPSAMKYGGIGTVVGHEITHAFDDVGRKFDKFGRLIQWWSSKDIKKFETRANCIRSQYSSYSIYGSHMNGNLSCGENIADNGGVKIAYQAFKKHLKKSRKTQALPGLHHLSDDQIFFVSFAKIWCDIESKARTLKGIVTDHHSYPKFRVIGALSNSKDFANAFRCRSGTRMNPTKKCIIW